MIWLAGGDPARLQEFSKIPLVDYYAILDAKLHDINEQLKKSKK